VRDQSGVADFVSKKVPVWAWSLLALLLGALVGLGLFTFVYAEGPSYLSDDPRTCINCHIMREQYDRYHHSSHKAVATCYGCHSPHDFIGKWLAKGINGWNHSVAFTLGNYPEPIRATGYNARIAQDNCVYCHKVLVSQIHSTDPQGERFCIDCHGNVGHGF